MFISHPRKGFLGVSKIAQLVSGGHQSKCKLLSVHSRSIKISDQVLKPLVIKESPCCPWGLAGWQDSFLGSRFSHGWVVDQRVRFPLILIPNVMVHGKPKGCESWQVRFNYLKNVPLREFPVMMATNVTISALCSFAQLKIEIVERSPWLEEWGLWR